MSLRRISLKDFVIVDTLEVDVSNGFTALTGETGAGKSILIDAVQIALGQRADAGVIRHGANRCDIVIEVDGTPDLYDWLIESGLDGDAGDYATTVAARKLIDILRSMPSDQTVVLESNQNKLLFKGGKSRFSLQTMAAEDFP